MGRLRWQSPPHSSPWLDTPVHNLHNHTRVCPLSPPPMTRQGSTADFLTDSQHPGWDPQITAHCQKAGRAPGDPRQCHERHREGDVISLQGSRGLHIRPPLSCITGGGFPGANLLSHRFCDLWPPSPSWSPSYSEHTAPTNATALAAAPPHPPGSPPAGLPPTPSLPGRPLSLRASLPATLGVQPEDLEAILTLDVSRW